MFDLAFPRTSFHTGCQVASYEPIPQWIVVWICLKWPLNQLTSSTVKHMEFT